MAAVCNKVSGWEHVMKTIARLMVVELMDISAVDKC